MKHSIVYAEDGMYAGWPANHGAWQWGDEFLVGFMRGPFTRRNRMHAIGQPFERVLARSLDGGSTWAVEKPNLEFLADVAGERPPAFELGGDTIIRVCGVYDHGGDDCDLGGGFYLSRDRGHAWSGPFAFTGLEEYFDGRMQCTARTAVLGDFVFLSAGDRDIWGTDYTFVALHMPVGADSKFEFIGTVCEDRARAVMPAVAETKGKIVCLLRRRRGDQRSGWVESFVSEDMRSWRSTGVVGKTGGRNGNPPALITLNDGRLLAAFGDRDFGSINGAISEDAGETWKVIQIRAGREESDEVDIGYPRLFLRTDGVPVCVYYWADNERPQQHIAATAVEGL